MSGGDESRPVLRSIVRSVRFRLPVLAVLLLSACAPSEIKTVANGDSFGRASALGSHATVTVRGTYTLGSGILIVDVEADPPQTVQARAQTQCSEDGRGLSEKRRESGGTPMAFPVHPDGCVRCVCTVTATGTLTGSGRIQVTLFGAGSHSR
jgi:hypothetical protein